jgi:adenylate cyclase
MPCQISYSRYWRRSGKFKCHFGPKTRLLCPYRDLMNTNNRLWVIWEEFRERKVLKVALVYVLMAWGVMQVGELLFEALQLPEGSYSLLVILILLGFPMALVLAWAYEITPEGVRRDVVSEVERRVEARLPLRNIPTEFLSDGSACVAILPFADLSHEQEEGQFCEGLAEEIQNELCKLNSLSVIARAHSGRYNAGTVDVREVAKELGVCAVLEGSVRQSNGDLRISVQLVNASNGVDVWSHSFDISSGDELDIQRDIARRLAESVRITLVEHHDSGCAEWNPLAFDCFRRGMDYFRRRSARNNEYARQMFNKAIEHEPCYGRAWAGLAYTWGFEYMSYNHCKSVREHAVKAAGKASKLNGASAESHVAQGIVLTLQDEPAQADASFQAAVAVDMSNFEAWYFNACNWVRQGEWARAIGLFERAAESNEEDYESVLLQSQLYVSLGKDEASTRALTRGLARARASLETRPDDYRALNLGALAYLQLGEDRLAAEWMSRSLQNSPPDAIIDYNAACYYSLLGDYERSRHYLDRCRSQGKLDELWLQNDSNLDGLRLH